MEIYNVIHLDGPTILNIWSFPVLSEDIKSEVERLAEDKFIEVIENVNSCNLLSSSRTKYIADSSLYLKDDTCVRLVTSQTMEYKKYKYHLASAGIICPKFNSGVVISYCPQDAIEKSKKTLSMKFSGISVVKGLFELDFTYLTVEELK